MKVVIGLLLIVVIVAMLCVMALGQGDDLPPVMLTETAVGQTLDYPLDWSPVQAMTEQFATEFARQTNEPYLDVPPVVATGEAGYPTLTPAPLHKEENASDAAGSPSLEGFMMRVMEQILRWQRAVPWE